MDSVLIACVLKEAHGTAMCYHERSGVEIAIRKMADLLLLMEAEFDHAAFLVAAGMKPHAAK